MAEGNSWLAWSEVCQPFGAKSAFIKQTSELWQYNMSIFRPQKYQCLLG